MRAAFEAGDWETLRLLLHPYLHWTEDGATIRGRANVLARLRESNRLPAPSAIDLRDAHHVIDIDRHERHRARPRRLTIGDERALHRRGWSQRERDLGLCGRCSRQPTRTLCSSDPTGRPPGYRRTVRPLSTISPPHHHPQQEPSG